MGREQRENLRHSLRLNMEILIGQKHYVGHTHNISIAGVLVSSDTFEPDPSIVGQQGKIWLETSEGEFEEFQCHVIHVSSRGIGAKFLLDDARDTDCLRQLIEELSD